MKKQDFPILKRRINGKKLVYLDNSATTQKPKQVIKAIDNYYKKHNANIHRGIHKLSEEATIMYEDAKRKIANFISADFEELIFTSGTTESLNLLAYSLSESLSRGDEIVLTIMEHHSNLVPWQQIAKEKGAKIKFIGITKDGTLDLEAAKKLITNKTKLVSITHVSNVLGTINPIKDLAKLAHTKGAILVVDAAQSVPHMSIDVKDLDCDFLAFSSHKMLGPMGIGALYGKKELLKKMKPFMYGGDMIKEVTLNSTSWADLPWKFEAGTPNVAGAIGFAKAVEYINKIGLNKIQKQEKEVTDYAINQLRNIPELTIYGPKTRAGLVSFNLDGIHPHDVSTILDRYGVAVRGGHHCAMPLMRELNIQGNVRASFYFYNTKKDVDILVKALKKVKEVFRNG